MIFCLYRTFLENSLSKQNLPSPHMLALCMQGEGESLSVFFLGQLHCAWFCLDGLKSCLDGVSVVQLQRSNQQPITTVVQVRTTTHSKNLPQYQMFALVYLLRSNLHTFAVSASALSERFKHQLLEPELSAEHLLDR